MVPSRTTLQVVPQLCIQGHHPAIQGDTAGCATAMYTGPSSMVPSRMTLQVVPQLCIQGHHPVIQDNTAGCATAVLRKENAVHTVYTAPSSCHPG